MSTKTNKKELTNEDLFNQVQDLKTKSDQIRSLANILDHDHKTNNQTSRISKIMDVRYQHVRNVLTQKLKKPTE